MRIYNKESERARYFVIILFPHAGDSPSNPAANRPQPNIQPTTVQQAATSLS